MKLSHTLLVMCAALNLGAASDENRYTEAALALDEVVAQQYAYLEKLPAAVVPQSEALAEEREAVRDSRSLLRYTEHRIASLADHHAITGSSFGDSWAVVPTYADIWVVVQNDQYIIDAVRDDSPTAHAAILPGQRIVSVGGVPIDQAVAAFWAELGLEVTPRRAAYAARVLVAGRRDRERLLSIMDSANDLREFRLASLYTIEQTELPPLTVCVGTGETLIRFNNSLGDRATIAAFDAAMLTIAPDEDLILDLRNTPSGGNTTIARAIMGWFVTDARGYQIHSRPVEERDTGIPRQWIEQVLPRQGKHRASLPTVRVGRWTGSMGEGLAIGFASFGADIQGRMMAGLNGSVEDLRVGDTDLTIKLPTERLLTTQGLAREDFRPQPIAYQRPLSSRC